MRISNPGQINDGLWLLGTKESCVYLLEGSQSSALISAGMSYIIPDLLRQIDVFGISANKIEHIIILHSHFDHVGVVPFLKRKWPHMTIYASARGWQVLNNPKAVAIINDYTLKVCRRVRGSADDLSLVDWQWRYDVQGETLGQGSRIDLGNRHIEIHDTPGHSSCSISAYVPQLKALFPSDAAAIPYRDEYVIAAGSSFRQYKQSLDKLSVLNVETLCADHYGYISGDEAEHYIARSKTAADQMIDKLLLALHQESSIEQAARQLVKNHFDQKPDYFVEPDILLRTYEHMLKQFVDTRAHST
jgi:glyoxylase-like metal-dependent hydrolase (beta-lactamase superfamily II)